MATRLFLGELTPGDFRIRIAKPGFNAADPALKPSSLQWDSAWQYSGTIHINGLAVKGAKSAVFPKLPYVPMVHVCPVSGIFNNTVAFYDPPNIGGKSKNIGRAVHYQGAGFNFDNMVVSRSAISWAGPATQTMMGYTVFRIPALSVDLSGKKANAERMVIGQRGGSFGAYVSRPGYSALGDEGNLIFSTDRVLPSIKQAIFLRATGRNATLVATNGQADALNPIADQGFIPQVLIFFGDADGGITQPVNVWHYSNFQFANFTGRVMVSRTTVAFSGRGSIIDGDSFYVLILILDQPNKLQ